METWSRQKDPWSFGHREPVITTERVSVWGEISSSPFILVRFLFRLVCFSLKLRHRHHESKLCSKLWISQILHIDVLDIQGCGMSSREDYVDNTGITLRLCQSFESEGIRVTFASFLSFASPAFHQVLPVRFLQFGNFLQPRSCYSQHWLAPLSWSPASSSQISGGCHRTQSKLRGWGGGGVFIPKRELGNLISLKFTSCWTTCKLIPVYKCIPIIIGVSPSPYAHFEVDSVKATLISPDFSKACFTVRKGCERRGGGGGTLWRATD